jgi:uncharacterized caspase-like protein
VRANRDEPARLVIMHFEMGISGFGACLILALVAGALPNSSNGESGDADKSALVINDPFAAPLWRVDVDPAEKYIVTGSPAKAAAVFAIDDAMQSDLLRAPIRKEEMQRAHAVAISPDARLTAYAVPPLRDGKGFARPGTAVIYLMERESGRIVEAIRKDVVTRPQALRFSPDGLYLAASLSDGCGLRVWRTEDWGLAASDDDGYGGGEPCCPAGAGGDCDSLPDTPDLAFSPAGADSVSLVTSGGTGLRIYSVTSDGIQLVAKKSASEIGLERPGGAVFSPDGAKLAVADARQPGTGNKVRLQVAVLDAKSLSPLGEPLAVPEYALLSPAYLDPKQVPAGDQMSLNRVAWIEANGETLIFAGGMLWCQIVHSSLIDGTIENEELDNCMVRWRIGPETSEAEAVRFVRVGIDRVMDIAALPNRNALLYATQRRVAVIELDGESYFNDQGQEVLKIGRALDFRDRPLDAGGSNWLGFHISDDASVVYIEDYRGARAAPIGLRFDISTLTLDRVSTVPKGLNPANRDPFLINKLGNWWNRRRPPVVYGAALSELAGIRDTYRSVALGPEKRVIIGSSNFVRVANYAEGSARVECQLRVAAEAFRVAVSKDGTVAVVGHGDGTVRWYRIVPENVGNTCDLAPLLAVHIRQTEWNSDEWTWTAWIPSTGHFASDGRAREMVGWQVEETGGQVSLVRFADLLQFYAPDEVRTALNKLEPEPEAVATKKESIIRAADPVKLMVLSPVEGEELETETHRFDVFFEGGGSWPRKMLVSIDGLHRAAKHHAGQEFGPNDPIEIAAPGIVQVDVTLPAVARQQHRNVQVCIQLDRQQTCRTINWAGPIEKPSGRRLRAVIVGFSSYAQPDMHLRYAQNDALDLAKIFVDDYRERVVEKTSGLVPDFDQVEIDLFVAPTTGSAKSQIDELKASGIVRVHEPSIRELRLVLKGLAEPSNARVLERDLFLFYFSGHGILNPYREQKGLTALLGPGINDLTPDAIANHALVSDELISSFESLGAEKIIIIDACRNIVGVTDGKAYDPAAVSLEFERQLLSADIFFSASPGQFSLDQGEYSYNDERPIADRGNGLFTYAVLRSLNEGYDAANAGDAERQVEVFDIDRYVRRFFKSAGDEGAAQALIKRLRAKGMNVTLQKPMFVPARRRPSETVVVRTIGRVRNGDVQKSIGKTRSIRDLD